MGLILLAQTNLGALRAVYHSGSQRETLRELARTYSNLVEDSTRVMQRLKALFRARGIRTPGTQVYHPAHRAEWLAQLSGHGVRFRAAALYAELDVLRDLRPRAKTALLTEARRDPAAQCCARFPSCPVRRAGAGHHADAGGFGRSGISACADLRWSADRVRITSWCTGSPCAVVGRR
jgi:hypothetical protein